MARYIAREAQSVDEVNREERQLEQRFSTFSDSQTFFKSHFPLQFFWVRRPPKRISPIFPISLQFFKVKDRKKHSNFHLQSSCDTIHEKDLSSQFRRKPA